MEVSPRLHEYFHPWLALAACVRERLGWIDSMHTRGAEPVGERCRERARPAADVECTCFGLDARSRSAPTRAATP